MAAACAKIAEPIPPELIVPPPPVILGAVQAGAVFRLRFNVPTLGQALDGNSVRSVALYRWISKQAGPDVAEFQSQATLVRRLSSAELEQAREAGALVVEDAVPVQPAPSYVHYALRTENLKSRASAWSALHSVAWARVPTAPSALTARYTQSGTELSWQRPPRAIDGLPLPVFEGYQIAAAETADFAERLAATFESAAESISLPDLPPTGETRYLRVRAVARRVPLATSQWSAAIAVQARDVFPPAAPSAVALFSSADRITLTWDPSPAPDLAGYNVYRSDSPSGEFVQLNPAPAAESRFSDTTALARVTYRYAVTAVDRTGNESSRSEVVSGSLSP